MSGPWWFCRSLASAQIFSCISALVQRYLLTILNSNDETSLSTESGQNCHIDTAFASAVSVFAIKCISVSPKQCLMQCLKFQTGCLVGVADPSRYPTQPLFQTASDKILFRMVWHDVSRRTLDQTCDQTIVKVEPLLTSFKRCTLFQVVNVPSLKLSSCEAGPCRTLFCQLATVWMPRWGRLWEGRGVQEETKRRRDQLARQPKPTELS